MSSSREVARTHSRVANTAKYHGSGSPEYIAASRDLAAALLEKRVREIVDTAPPLTAAQKSRLSALIASSGCAD